MISNTSTLTKEDFKSTEKYRRFNLRSVIFSLIMFACGGYLLYLYIPYIYHVFIKEDWLMPTDQLVQVICFSLIALFFIFMGIFLERIISLKAYKQAREYLTRSYTFTEEGLDCIAKTPTIDQQNLFKYSCFTGYAHTKDKLFIHIIMNKRKFNLVLHDNGYTEGSVDEAIELLESKGIKSDK